MKVRALYIASMGSKWEPSHALQYLLCIYDVGGARFTNGKATISQNTLAGAADVRVSANVALSGGVVWRINQYSCIATATCRNGLDMQWELRARHTQLIRQHLADVSRECGTLQTCSPNMLNMYAPSMRPCCDVLRCWEVIESAGPQSVHGIVAGISALWYVALLMPSTLTMIAAVLAAHVHAHISKLIAHINNAWCCGVQATPLPATCVD